MNIIVAIPSITGTSKRKKILTLKTEDGPLDPERQLMNTHTHTHTHTQTDTHTHTISYFSYFVLVG